MSEGTKDQQVEKQRKNEVEDKVRTKVIKRGGEKGGPSERKRNICVRNIESYRKDFLHKCILCVISYNLRIIIKDSLKGER